MNAYDIDLDIDLPSLKLKGLWHVSEAEKAAVWELYVELATRISTIPLNDDSGLIREALSSLYSLFGTTRDILKRHGPAAATASHGNVSFGMLATTVLNEVVRPYVAKWHVELEDWEMQRRAEVSRYQHERAWPRNHLARKGLAELRPTLVAFNKILQSALSSDGSVSIVRPEGPTYRT